MKVKDWGYCFILLLFIAAGIISWRIYFREYRQSDSVNIHYFPKTIGDWTAEELPISDEEKALLETDNVFVRRYTNPLGEEVFLFTVYSQNNRKVSHPPEICYTGGGATILDSVRDRIEAADDGSVPVNRLTVERGETTQIFVYWFKVGDTFTSNYWAQQGLIALKSLQGYPASSALIRISATVHNEQSDEAVGLIKKFGRLVVPDLNKYLP